MRAKRNDVADHCVLAILADEEFLLALSLRTADQDVHFRETFRLAGFDPRDLPAQLRIVAECFVQKRIYFLFRRQVRRSVRAEILRFCLCRFLRGLLLRRGKK